MAEEVVTQEEVVRRLGVDPIFAIEFAVENQPQEIIQNLQSLGFQATTDEQAMRVLLNLWEGKAYSTFTSALDVPYNNNSGNWTEGFGSLFPDPELSDPAPVGQTQRSALWGSILTGIGAFATQLGGSGSTGTSVTPAQIEAARLAEEKRIAEEKKKQQRLFLIIGLTIVVIAVVGVILWSRKKKKK